MLLAAIAEATDDDTPLRRSQRLQEALQLAIDLAELRALREFADEELDSQVWIVELARSSDPLIASLFEAHLAPHQRERRLSPGAVFADVASLTGDAARGQAYFFDSTRSQCAQCHRVGDSGGQVGPVMDGIGVRQTPAQLFESIVDPSRVVEARYQSRSVLTTDGRVVTGLLAESSDERLVLITAQGERLTIATEEIDMQQTSRVSLMPSGLAAGMTAQQMADLLAYLGGL